MGPGPIIVSLATLGSILVAAGITVMVNRLGYPKGRFSTGKKILIFLLFFMILFLTGGLIYFNMYFHVTDEGAKYLQSSADVKVDIDETYTLYDGPGSDTAFIFYPGAKVEAAAYAPVLNRIAAQGVDCISVEMPLHMAFTDRMAAWGVMKRYSYDNWYVGGHSLGGAMVSVFAAANGTDNGLKGLILFASYTDEDISDDLRVLAVMCSEDKVMQWENYEKSKYKMPSDFTEVVIAGGNHAGFGAYGEQPGDGVALISQDEQHEKIADVVVDFILGGQSAADE